MNAPVTRDQSLRQKNPGAKGDMLLRSLVWPAASPQPAELLTPGTGFSYGFLRYWALHVAKQA